MIDRLPTNVFQVLRELGVELQGLGKTLTHVGLPEPTLQLPESALIDEELGRYPVEAQAAERDQYLPCLNSEQRRVYQEVMDAVFAPEGSPSGSRAFFIDGLGGSGKTFTYSCLLSAVRARGKVAVAVASSGIAALLLPGGRTAHSRFKFSVGNAQNANSFISWQSELAEFLSAETNAREGFAYPVLPVRV